MNYDSEGGYGYSRGMSNRAVSAYIRGIKPLSKIRKSDLEEAGFEGTLKTAKTLAKYGMWTPCEWHHSSGYYNRVDFYNPEDLLELNDDEIKEVLELEKSKPKTEEKKIRVTGHYLVWGGSRNRPKVIGKKKFKGVLIGKWIHVDGGGRKKANGNYIEYEEVKED